MNTSAPRPDATAPAPQAFRDALAELVQNGLSVSRLLARTADAETALAEAAAQIRVAEGVSPFATSLAEAIEADRAIAAAAEARPTVVARAETIAAAFARVSRAIRLTIMLAERLERGWARGGVSDDRRTMARRQIAREVEDAIDREAGERPERLTEALDRLESLDVEDELADRPVEEVVAEICRLLGLDPARLPVRPPFRDPPRQDGATPTAGSEAAPLAGGGRGWEAPPPQRLPDG